MKRLEALEALYLAVIDDASSLHEAKDESDPLCTYVEGCRVCEAMTAVKESEE